MGTDPDFAAAAKSGSVPGFRRLFFALWPDARVREALGTIGRDAQAECGGRAVASEKVHITLFFLGNVERDSVAALKTLASAIHGRAFELALDVLGYWRHNRIVWVGTRECPEALAALAARLRSALVEAGFEDEPRAYVPHVTLVRNGRRAPRNVKLEPIRWAVRDFALVESVQAGGQARYDVLARWPLLV